MAIIKKVSESFESFKAQDQKIAITGLSRSGKTMFFTSLIYLLKKRAQSNYDYNMPLLKSLPVELIDQITLERVEDVKLFNYAECLDNLKNGEWPASTDDVFAFKLEVELIEDRFFHKYLQKHRKIVFEFYDYPGEWLTDIPMLDKSYEEWSRNAFYQQSMSSLKDVSSVWHDYIENFDFDQSPNPSLLAEIMNIYQVYIIAAKKMGITLIQPASLLIDSTDYDWNTKGFAPLPDYVLSDKMHPWTQYFNENFERFKSEWLKPLKEQYFKKTDKQVVFIDLLEGLNFGQDHLKQLKSTLTNLAETFVYANQFFHKFVGSKKHISKVAFVATKVDLIPLGQRGNFRNLLINLTSGITNNLNSKAVEFDFFLVSSINTTATLKNAENAIIYKNERGDTIKREFKEIPSRILGIKNQESFPVPKTCPGKNFDQQIAESQGIDALLDYMIGGK